MPLMGLRDGSPSGVSVTKRLVFCWFNAPSKVCEESRNQPTMLVHENRIDTVSGLLVGFSAVQL